MTSGAAPLAALRIVVALLWVTLSATHHAPALAEVPIVSRPWGMGWMQPWIDGDAARVAQVAVFIGAFFGGIGVFARAGFAVVTVAGLYLLAIPQFHGGVQHYHHLLWFAALLAVSPASDAFTVRSFMAAPGRTRAWGVPTRVAWGLIAAMYFFPGIHKLWAQGLGWAGDNLITLMHWKWAQAWDFVPLTRIDRWPTVVWLGGLGVLAFEIGAPLWLYNRWSRGAFVLMAGIFHLSTSLWFDIDFWHLWVCFVVMLPFPEGGEVTDGESRPALAMGVLLFAGVLGTGAMGITQGWPFACYPTFDRPTPEWMPTIVLVGHDVSGREWPVPEHALTEPSHSKRFYSEVWGLTGLYGVDDPVAVEGFWGRVRHRPAVIDALGEAEWVTLHGAKRTVVPGHTELHVGREVGSFSL